ncbi:Glycine--tRNA ligase [archaeon HR01]|nr:Glycine--tRNA ligase [archaeon HR01]
MAIEDVVRLALERGYFFPTAEIYPRAPAGFWEYGPLGTQLKRKFVEAWLREIVRRDEMLLIDGSQILPRDVFVASGHLETFADPISSCTRCNTIYRIDRLLEEHLGVKVPERTPPEEIDAIIRVNNFRCPSCGGELSPVSLFNMMFGLRVGGAGEEAYLRPETCQNIFIDFPRLYKISRRKLPIAFAQLGKSFRNEISPRQSLLRMREFTQAEVEVFFNPSKADDFEKFDVFRDYHLQISIDGEDVRMTCGDAVGRGIVSSRLVGYYLGLIQSFYLKLGIPPERLRLRRLGEAEKAFYAREGWDLEVLTSAGWVELVACNNRGDYDLSGHGRVSGADLTVTEDGVKVLPHIFELSMGVDRSILALLDIGYAEKGGRRILKMHPSLSPYTAAILPLLDRDELVSKARQVYDMLRLDFDVFFDTSGSIGRRYRRQDEIGTPYCITIDFETLKDDTVTVRDRDTMGQERLPITRLAEYISKAMRI